MKGLEEMLSKIEGIMGDFSLNDITGAGLPPNAVTAVVGGKLGLLQNMAKDDFFPVRTYPDGRVILEYAGTNEQYLKKPFRQLHGGWVDGAKFGILCYSVPTSEGLPIDDKNIMRKVKETMLDESKQIDMPREGAACTCPDCVSERIDKAKAKTAHHSAPMEQQSSYSPVDKGTLH